MDSTDDSTDEGLRDHHATTAIERHGGQDLLLARFESSERLKRAAFEERRLLDVARRDARTTSGEHQKALLSLKGSRERESELLSGHGALLFNGFGIKVYEFRLQLPGFSGSIRGAAAQLNQHGDVHQVSDVTSKTKSGLGGAVVGGLLLGPVGAVAGLAATRKNNVKTTIKTVDTRQFELEIRGPGFAWSTLQGPSAAPNLRTLRDVINARGSSDSDASDALASHVHTLSRHRQEAEQLEATVQSKRDALSLQQQALSAAIERYAAVRLAFTTYLKARWARSTTLGRVGIVAFSPIIIPAWFIKHCMERLVLRQQR